MRFLCIRRRYTYTEIFLKLIDFSFIFLLFIFCFIFFIQGIRRAISVDDYYYLIVLLQTHLENINIIYLFYYYYYYYCFNSKCVVRPIRLDES